MSASYRDSYEAFLQRLDSEDQIGPIDVARKSAEFVKLFMELKEALVFAHKKVAEIAVDIENRVDEKTGKPITSAKAKVFLDATPEMGTEDALKADIDNLEHVISALLRLQRAMEFEYKEARS